MDYARSGESEKNFEVAGDESAGRDAQDGVGDEINWSFNIKLYILVPELAETGVSFCFAVYRMVIKRLKIRLLTPRSHAWCKKSLWAQIGAARVSDRWV
jgi:hypothetical protein